ncbi:MAG TPA: hypothetical protein VK050_04290 [Flavobacteriaceae bacterium]|nr:hypothetical protein [Flavobacteriaceae bacterium]
MGQIFPTNWTNPDDFGRFWTDYPSFYDYFKMIILASEPCGSYAVNRLIG